MTIPAMAQRYLKSLVWKNDSSILLSYNKVLSTILSFLGTFYITSSYLPVEAYANAKYCSGRRKCM